MANLAIAFGLATAGIGVLNTAVGPRIAGSLIDVAKNIGPKGATGESGSSEHLSESKTWSDGKGDRGYEYSFDQTGNGYKAEWAFPQPRMETGEFLRAVLNNIEEDMEEQAAKEKAEAEEEGEEAAEVGTALSVEVESDEEGEEDIELTLQTFSENSETGEVVAFYTDEEGRLGIIIVGEDEENGDRGDLTVLDADTLELFSEESEEEGGFFSMIDDYYNGEETGDEGEDSGSLSPKARKKILKSKFKNLQAYLNELIDAIGGEGGGIDFEGALLVKGVLDELISAYDVAIENYKEEVVASYAATRDQMGSQLSSLKEELRAGLSGENELSKEDEAEIKTLIGLVEDAIEEAEKGMRLEDADPKKIQKANFALIRRSVKKAPETFQARLEATDENGDPALGLEERRKVNEGKEAAETITANVENLSDSELNSLLEKVQVANNTLRAHDMGKAEEAFAAMLEDRPDSGAEVDLSMEMAPVMDDGSTKSEVTKTLETASNAAQVLGGDIEGLSQEELDEYSDALSAGFQAINEQNAVSMFSALTETVNQRDEAKVAEAEAKQEARAEAEAYAEANPGVQVLIESNSPRSAESARWAGLADQHIDDQLDDAIAAFDGAVTIDENTGSILVNKGAITDEMMEEFQSSFQGAMELVSSQGLGSISVALQTSGDDELDQRRGPQNADQQAMVDDAQTLIDNARSPGASDADVQAAFDAFSSVSTEVYATNIVGSWIDDAQTLMSTTDMDGDVAAAFDKAMGTLEEAHANPTASNMDKAGEALGTVNAVNQLAEFRQGVNEQSGTNLRENAWNSMVENNPEIAEMKGNDVELNSHAVDQAWSEAQTAISAAIENPTQSNIGAAQSAVLDANVIASADAYAFSVEMGLTEGSEGDFLHNSIVELKTAVESGDTDSASILMTAMTLFQGTSGRELPAGILENLPEGVNPEQIVLLAKNGGVAPLADSEGGKFMVNALSEVLSATPSERENVLASAVADINMVLELNVSDNASAETLNKNAIGTASWVDPSAKSYDDVQQAYSPTAAGDMWNNFANVAMEYEGYYNPEQLVAVHDAVSASGGNPLLIRGALAEQQIFSNEQLDQVMIDLGMPPQQ